MTLPRHTGDETWDVEDRDAAKTWPSATTHELDCADFRV